jgi:hypothetical protein
MIVLLVCTAVCLHAQTANPAVHAPKPQQAPLPIRKPAAFAHWQVKVEPSKGEKVDPNSVDSIDFVKANNVGYAVTTLKGGTRTVTWVVDDLALDVPPGQKTIYVTKVSDSRVPDEMFLTDYPGFEWVTPERFAGEVAFAGVKCYYYRDEAGREAWASVEGQWPVASRDSGILRKFNHLKAAEGQALQLPPEFQKAVDTYLGK